jgi:Putative phage abortive infection protein
MKPKEAKLKQPPWWPFYILALPIVASWLFWPRFLNFFPRLQGTMENGQFGDSYGALNTLFSGMAFAALGYTMWMQRSELAETREILRSQKEEAEEQNRTLARQTFENTFFQLLRMHNDNLSSMDLRRSRVAEISSLLSASTGGEVYAVGRECFSTFYNKFKIAYSEYQTTNINRSINDELAIINHAYQSMFNYYEADLGHYFRTLYHIVKLIDQNGIGDKKFYTNLVRAQLSKFEICLIFYNGLSFNGATKFKLLIEKYKFLHNLNIDELAKPDEHKKLYQQEAFGDIGLTFLELKKIDFLRV